MRYALVIMLFCWLKDLEAQVCLLNSPCIDGLQFGTYAEHFTLTCLAAYPGRTITWACTMFLPKQNLDHTRLARV